MQIIQAAPASTTPYWSPIYVVGGYRFRVEADHNLTTHEAIACAGRFLQEHRAELRPNEVNAIALIDEHA